MSVISPPLFVLLIFSAVFLMATGETTYPWDLTPSGSNPGLAGQDVEIALENEAVARDSKSGASDLVGSHSGLTPLFTPQVMYWEEKIVAWAYEWNLDPNLVATLMQIESCGDPKALSHAGAMGLFQVMPYHFSEGEQPYKPNTNARRGLGYLRRALDEHNSIRLAFAGYNGGIGIAGELEYYWKDETVRFVYWGTGIYNDAQQGRSNSPRLNEWLSYGGTSLCAQASERLGLTP
ncbi:MAG: transglycosylase SLT domain-containing protein [Anaerolineales bacterium]|jgi:soluble lytic murein transglycosylase-like protein